MDWSWEENHCAFYILIGFSLYSLMCGEQIIHKTLRPTPGEYIKICKYSNMKMTESISVRVLLSEM